MVGESVPPALVPRALALDTLTNSVTRMIGPIIAGALYQFVGLAGAFAVSAAMYLVAAMLAAGLPHQQEIRRLVLSHVPRDLAEGFSYARGHTVIAGVLHGHHRDEPAGVSRMPRWWRRSGGSTSWCRPRWSA